MIAHINVKEAFAFLIDIVIFKSSSTIRNSEFCKFQLLNYNWMEASCTDQAIIETLSKSV